MVPFNRLLKDTIKSDGTLVSSVNISMETGVFSNVSTATSSSKITEILLSPESSSSGVCSSGSSVSSSSGRITCSTNNSSLLHEKNNNTAHKKLAIKTTLKQFLLDKIHITNFIWGIEWSILKNSKFTIILKSTFFDEIHSVFLKIIVKV